MDVNQIVRGQRAGTFVILGFEFASDAVTRMATLKCINPLTSETSPGEIRLPVDCLRPVGRVGDTPC